jgi:hypothetical protein
VLQSILDRLRTEQGTIVGLKCDWEVRANTPQCPGMSGRKLLVSELLLFEKG